MSDIKAFKIQQIKYVKDNYIDVSIRTIIPSFVPKLNITALDVTDLNTDDQQQTEQLIQDYNDYVKLQSQAMFNFENWVEHTHPDTDLTLKWRTFKRDNISIL